MDDLAAELGMSKKTLYAHFASKAALLEAVLDDKIQQAERDFSQMAEKATADFQSGLEHLLSCLRRHSEELQPAFTRDMAREEPALFGRVQVRRRAMIQKYFGRLLEEGQRCGRIRADISAELAIEILISTTDAVANPQRLAQLGLPAGQCLSAIVTIFLEGMLLRKPSKKS